jgi:hypothetical protein
VSEKIVARPARASKGERAWTSEEIDAELALLKFAIDTGQPFDKERLVTARRQLDALIAEDGRQEREILWRAANPPSGCSEHEENVAAVIRTALHGSPEAVARMADIARGAKAPGQTFTAALVRLVVFSAPGSLGLPPALRVEYWTDAAIPGPRLPLLDGLSREEAIALMSKLLERYSIGKLTAVGLVTDLVFAALQRGVSLGTFSRASTRTHVLKAIDNAVMRHRST